MALTREQKKQVIQKIKENLERQKAIFFIDFQKLKAKDLFDLREQLKEKKSLLYIAKKTLINIAFKEKKIPVDVDKLEGQIGLIFGFEDEILPAKIIYNTWQEKGSPEILGGFLEGEFIEKEKVIELAKLPSKEELLVRLIQSINSPIANLANILQANIKGLIYILSQVKTQ